MIAKNDLGKGENRKMKNYNPIHIMPNQDRKEEQQEPERELDEPMPKSNKERPGRDKLFERMRKVDPSQSEKYKQRTGE